MSTVTVSLKHPNGIIMQVGNTRQVINGWHAEERVIVSNIEKVGLTHDVDENFWKAWLKENANHKLVKKDLIFANASPSKARAESKERKGVTSGHEALDKDAKKAGVE